MSRLILLLLVFTMQPVLAQQFYNRYPSTRDLHIYTETDVLELNGAYYKVETESNNALSFHSNIRIIKTDALGTIMWIKRYDAGVDSSLQVTSINSTLDNNIIVNGVLSNDNIFPPIGITTFKLDTAGAVLWSVVMPGFRSGYYSKDVVQLQDSSFVFDAMSSAGLVSAVVKLDKNGNFVSSKVFQNTVYPSSNIISSMLYRNNQLSIAFHQGEYITTDTAFNVTYDKDYNLDHTGAYFVHTITSNGDRVFVDDIESGGSLGGKCRIFRADANGNLIWAKSLTIWNSFTVHTPFTLYDVVRAVKVMEDTSSNIVMQLLDEGGVGLLVTFDANGNYITNKVIRGAEVKLCVDGDFIFVSNLQIGNALGMFAKQQHYNLNTCDSLIDVEVAAGTDSASNAVIGVSSLSIPISLQNFPVHVIDTTTTPVFYCPIFMGVNETTAQNSQLQIYPDPATEFIYLEEVNPTDNHQLEIFDSMGKRITNSKLISTKINITHFPPGVYFVVVDGGKWRGRFMKIW